ncbi:MAG: methylated-DNA--[protein]-cysteine S-methyltransferase [Candidatus Eisenbacteria bacterium]|uniref:methylated-DNA--[protein]-cysteine S-methyltransferase n=1 Tax=Eiseniibacteriota bacterium TaxID=2212470 RepID=A0A538TIS7_UNCEI|nr:MAG: methylated-DNA--[protein]-cysteine S-methyltransferase [Candidatus Eisenbacteria bacterium]
MKSKGAREAKSKRASEKKAKAKREEVAQATIRAPLGKVWVLATESGLREIRLSSREAPTRAEMRSKGWKLIRRPRWTDPVRRLIEGYLTGTERRLEIPLDLGAGTPFQRRVWEAARKIPYGTAASYVDLARLAGYPRASRAVGNALGANPVPIVVPCHRVIHADRSIGGFSSGLTWKRFLLELERGQLELPMKPRRRFLFKR